MPTSRVCLRTVAMSNHLLPLELRPAARIDAEETLEHVGIVFADAPTAPSDLSRRRAQLRYGSRHAHGPELRVKQRRDSFARGDVRIAENVRHVVDASGDDLVALKHGKRVRCRVL